MKQDCLASLLIVASLVLTPFSSLRAQDMGKPFIVQARTDKGKVPMAFHVAHWGHLFDYAAVGYDQYNKPAIPIETKGEMFIPDSVTTPDGRCLQVCWISRGCFQNCGNITAIHLPHTIETISDLAFQNCKSLREITLSDSLQVIYPQAFAGCDALRRIIFRSPNPPRTYFEGTFEERTINTATIVVPFGSADKYLEDNFLSRFRHHMELISTCPGQ